MAGNDAFFDGFLDDYYAESEEHLTAAQIRCCVSTRSSDNPLRNGPPSTIYFDTSTR